MMRECQVRICEGLGVKFSGPTRQTRRFGDVGLISGLPRKRTSALHHRWLQKCPAPLPRDPFDPVMRASSRHSPNGTLWNVRASASVGLDARELDHVSPFLGFLGDELAE